MTFMVYFWLDPKTRERFTVWGGESRALYNRYRSLPYRTGERLGGCRESNPSYTSF
jgi:hypothetical protein